MKKGQIFTEIIFKIANVIIVVVVLGIIAHFLFPGFFTIFGEAETSREVHDLTSHIEREICSAGRSSGTFPPSGSVKNEYNFRDVDSIDTEGNTFRILMEGADQARTVEHDCDDIDRIVLCDDEERSQDITQCEPPGDELPSDGYSFIYRFDGNTLYMMVEREIIDDGPFIYYLSRDGGDHGLRSVSISENIVYEPENQYAGATTAGDYEGRTISFSGDLRMIGFDSGLVVGNQTDIFRYEKTDHSTESIRHEKPISVLNLGGIGMVREGEIEEEVEGQYCGEWATEENIRDMARILWVEARGRTRESRIAIGYTVMRTMVEWGTNRIGIGEEGMPITRYGHGHGDYKHIYYEGTERRWDDIPRENNGYGQFEEVSRQVLECRVPDLGNGATHYYSPYSMPDTSGDTYDHIETGSVEEVNSYFDILPSDACLDRIGEEITEQDLVEEIGGRTSYIPTWANQDFGELEPGHPCYANVLEYVPSDVDDEFFFKFYRNPDWEDFEFYERDFGEWGGNEIAFVNGTHVDQERQVCMYNYLDERSLECISNEYACRAEFVGDIGDPGDGTNKIFFGDNSENIYSWDGEGGRHEMEDCADESYENIVEYEVRDYECGNFESGETYDIMDMSNFYDITGDGNRNEKLVIAREQEVRGMVNPEKHLSYIEFEDVCGDGDETLKLNKLYTDREIVSLGETHDGKVPFTVMSDGEYLLKYYDIFEEEVVDVEAANETVRVGAFSDYGG